MLNALAGILAGAAFALLLSGFLTSACQFAVASILVHYLTKV